jgi:hypothetical protein
MRYLPTEAAKKLLPIKRIINQDIDSDNKYL